VNNRHYTEYIPVVPSYLINNYKQIVHDIQHLVNTSNVDHKNKESCQQRNVFRAICYEFAGPNCLKIYFMVKGLKYGIDGYLYA
jgi:hypothetical protein